MTTRDRWLAAALPAFVSLLAGWLFILRPGGREINALRLRVEAQGPLSVRQALVAQAQADRAELLKAIAGKRDTVATGGTYFNRNSAMQQVSLLCAAHGLSLDATAPEPGGLLAPALVAAAPAFTRGGDATVPQVWRIEVSGGYPGIVQLLEGLRRAKPLIVPLNLSMETGKTGRIPTKWVLTLWL